MADISEFDAILSTVGDFGKQQIILMALFSIINVLSGFHYFGQIFISLTPRHECDTQKYADKSNVSARECSVVYLENNTWYEETCRGAWVYHNNSGFISIVEELNWVCHKDWNASLGQSVFFMGSVLGSLILGILADRIGRLHVLVISNMFAWIGNITTMISNDVVIFAASRFLAGCATDCNFVMMYIIVMEYIRPSMRTFGLNLCIGVFYCLSCVIVPWIAVLLGNWKTFLIVISAPHLLIIGYYLLVPESAQWLISKGRSDKAIACFQRVARTNGKILRDKEIESLKTYCSQKLSANVEHENLLGLLKTPKLRRKTLILVFKSMVMTLCYDAISRNVSGLGFSPFVLFSITSATIFPSCLLILAVQDKIGRKSLASGSFLVSGIFTACSGIILASVSSPDPRIIVALAFIARLAITVAYNSGAQYAVELIPVVVRGQGVSAVHVAGYAASFFSPQILYLAAYWKPAPEVILGLLLAMGSIACLFLPETLNKALPITLEEGESFGEDEGIFEFAWRRAPTESTTALARDFARYDGSIKQ